MQFKLTGDWKIEINGQEFSVDSAEVKHVEGELHRGCYGKNASDKANWTTGQRFVFTITFETTLQYSLVPGSVKLRDESGYLLQEGKDYNVSWQWGTFWMEGTTSVAPGCTLYADYDYRWQRIDSVFENAAGELRYVKGEYAASCPVIPEAGQGERRLLNIHVLPEMERLEEKRIFPVYEDLDEDNSWQQSVALQQSLIPATIEKLRRGDKVRIFAWGDSITEGAFLMHKQRWQNQLVEWLRREYPAADIELETLGWGGRRMRTFREEPAGSPYNYREQVLPRAEKADIVISEFNNDCGEKLDFLQEQYSSVLKDFRERNTEWIILSSNYSMPSWMPFPADKQTEQGEWLLDDPREAMQFKKRYAAENS